MRSCACFLFFLLLFIQNLYPQDSIPATDLKEVVVESERAWIENGVYNFIPTKKDKQLSNSPGSLINRMNIPLLRGDREGIMTTSNEHVSIFINGNPATEIDIATFLTKDVKKVEYIQNPSDPKFRGVKNAVNFIVTEYSFGGVTRAEIMQHIPDRGVYLLGSKLTYKEMTYGLRFLGKYNRWNTTAETEDIYKNIWFDDTPYDEIHRNYSSHSKGHNYDFDIGANAIYSNDKGFRAVHTLSLGFDRSPGSSGSGVNSWSENIFSSDYSASYSSERSLRPSISGDYSADLSSKVGLTGFWQFTHGDNSNYFWNIIGEDGKVENESKENIESLKARLEFSYSINSRWSAELSASPTMNWYSTQYTGDTNSHQNQFREDMNVGLSVWYRPNQKFSFRLSPGFIQSHYKVDEDLRKEIRPDFSLSGRWNPNRKFMMNLSLQAFRFGASASEANPVLIQLSELEWATGNPNLKNSVHWSARLNLYYQPCNWLSISGDVYYWREENAKYTLYSAAPKELGGIIRSTLNAPSSDDLKLQLGLSTNFFSRKLSLFLLPSIDYRRCRGDYAGGHVTGSVNGSLEYRLQNVLFELSYNPGQRVYGVAGNTYYRKSDSFSFSVSYGISDWYLSCGIGDIFHSKRKDVNRDLSPVFDSYSVSKQRGRQCFLNVTYTIGYGKKVDSYIDVNGAASVETSVIR